MANLERDIQPEILERDIQPEIRLALSRAGANLFRNNVGLAFMGPNRDMPVKFGLCTGSSDLIGYMPVVITHDMVGKTVAVFTAIETKRPSGGRRRPGQVNFVEQVIKAGGLAGFARSVAEALRIVDNSTK